MLNPSTWIDAVRIKCAINNYPVYKPPHAGSCMDLSGIQAEDNFKYFLSTREARLECLYGLLKRFNVIISSDIETVHEVGMWLHRFGAHLLVDTGKISGKNFRSFIPEWSGQNRGLNVVWDLGIYAGECIIQRNQQAHWGLDLGDRSRISREMPGYLRPCIKGVRKPGRVDVFTALLEGATWKRLLNTVGYPAVAHAARPEYFEEIISHWSEPEPEAASRR